MNANVCKMDDSHASNGSSENAFLLVSDEARGTTPDAGKFPLVCERNGCKEKLKWMSSLNDLKDFVRVTLKLDGTWSTVTNNGGFHVFKCAEVTLSFYPGTKTLTSQGPKQHHYRKILLKSCDKSEQSVATTTSEQETGNDLINNSEREEVDTFEAAEDNVMFDSSQACCADGIARIWNEIETIKKQQLPSKTEQLDATRENTQTTRN